MRETSPALLTEPEARHLVMNEMHFRLCSVCNFPLFVPKSLPTQGPSALGYSMARLCLTSLTNLFLFPIHSEDLCLEEEAAKNIGVFLYGLSF